MSVQLPHEATALIDNVGEFLRSSEPTSSLDELLNKAQTLDCLENIIKHSLYEHLLTQYENSLSAETSHVEQFLELLCYIGEKKYIRMIRFFAFLEDIFEALPLIECEVWFAWCEKNRFKIRTLTQSMKEEECGFVVKAFQVILKRLDKTIQFNLYGRVLTLIASIISFSNLSGTNRKGETSGLDPIEVVEFDPEKPFYFKLWSLLKNFMGKMDVDISMFQSLREVTKELDASLEKIKSQALQTKYLPHQEGFFSKLFINPSIFDIQMQDYMFIRQILTLLYIQMVLIKTPSPDTNVEKEKEKMKTEGNDERANVIAAANSAKLEITKLLRKTPGGVRYFEALSNSLEHEKMWADWKNNKCAPFERPPSNPLKKRSYEDIQKESAEWLQEVRSLNPVKKKKIHIREGFKNSSNLLRTKRESHVDMGCPHINKIWNNEPEKYNGSFDLVKLLDLNDMPIGHEEVDMLDWMMRRSILRSHDLELYYKVVVLPNDKERELNKKKYGLKAYKKLILKGVDNLEKYNVIEEAEKALKEQEAIQAELDKAKELEAMQHEENVVQGDKIAVQDEIEDTQTENQRDNFNADTKEYIQDEEKLQEELPDTNTQGNHADMENKDTQETENVDNRSVGRNDIPPEIEDHVISDIEDEEYEV